MEYTVIGVWVKGEPVSVGVIAGIHEVGGGDWDAFDEGLWATTVEAEDIYQAEVDAATKMIEGEG